ncbi:TPA: hypothetical protein ACN1M9_002664 [Enterococcus faecalis]|uniref:hypothetical protein n=1 Tax=Enterococcus faecalis TaxID=1351 RepID=UPI001030E2A4|nr:hypothetical protein [Enterococcus faecalis]EKF8800576.1 hypothetical protein [Enterococcus faecalis]TBH14493.1 hypothetical protein EYC52_14755 [Enterococcus faecalis]HCT6699373.1 hypothetical protein [Enterococcus faecalis]
MLITENHVENSNFIVHDFQAEYRSSFYSEIFQSEVNKNGATLIFSTHYSELLDNIRRKEVIKVLRKEKGELMIESLTNLAKKKGKDRTDIKSSDLILSGIFGTAPDYSKYNQLKKSLIREIYGSESSE